MFAVCVMLRLKPGTQDKFLPLIEENAKTSLAEELDCHRFDVATDTADPHAVFLYELYANRSGLDAHLASDHYQRFEAASAEMIADKVVVTWDTVH